MPNLSDEEFSKALGVSTDNAADMFEMAVREAEKRRQPVSLPSSISTAERFLKGASAAGQRGYYGVKGAILGLSPEERQRIAAQEEWVKRAGLPAQAGEIAGNIGMYAPTMAISGAGVLPAAQRAFSSGLLSALFEPGDTYKREKAAASGAIGSVAGEAVPYAAGTLTRAIEPLLESGRTNILSRTLQRAIGENASGITRELETAKSGVPGVRYTASEAAPRSGGLAAIQRWAEQANPEAYFQRRAENVGFRKLAMQDIAGSEMEKVANISARESVSAPLYEAAMQRSVPVNDELRELLARPSMKNALAQAKQIAAEKGTPISQEFEDAIMSGEVPAEISGQGLHWLKIGLDSLRDEAKTSLSKAQQNALKGTVNSFEAWREANIPEYAKAQKAYKDLSKPINRQTIGQTLYEKLTPALSDFGPMTREKSETFARALRDADITAQQAVGFKGAKFEDIMSPQDQELYESIASDLARQAESAGAGRGIGSNTFQNIAMQNLAERSGFPGTIIGKAMRFPLIDYAYTRAEQSMQKELADALLDPRKTAELIKRRPGLLTMLLDAEYAQAPGALVGSAVGSSLNR